MPSTPCLHAGCPNVAVRLGRCASHAASYDRAIPRVGKDIYRKRKWQATRRRKLSINHDENDGMCEAPDCEATATQVHHKHGVEADPFSIAGLESLCASCHSRITRQDQIHA